MLCADFVQVCDAPFDIATTHAACRAASTLLVKDTQNVNALGYGYGVIRIRGGGRATPLSNTEFTHGICFGQSIDPGSAPW